MKLVRFFLPNCGVRMGVIKEDNGIYDLTEITGGKITSFFDLLRESKENKASLEEIIASSMDSYKNAVIYNYEELDSAPASNKPFLMIPLDPPEVWAAGVTYKRSVDARIAETQVKDVYDRVYSAKRPEIFFKASAARVVGPGEKIGIRSDSAWMVPEPELGVVIGENLSILGYIIGNDVSSRDIEGENPLYLPQAKIFKNSCALGPVVALNSEIANPYLLAINCEIIRGNEVVFSGEANTSQLKRTIEELVSYLGQDNVIYPGTILLTGTSIVPPDSFSLTRHDTVRITIDHLGTLSNQVG